MPSLTNTVLVVAGVATIVYYLMNQRHQTELKKLRNEIKYHVTFRDVETYVDARLVTERRQREQEEEQNEPGSEIEEEATAVPSQAVQEPQHAPPQNTQPQHHPLQPATQPQGFVGFQTSTATNPAFSFSDVAIQTQQAVIDSLNVT